MTPIYDTALWLDFTMFFNRCQILQILILIPDKYTAQETDNNIY